MTSLYSTKQLIVDIKNADLQKILMSVCIITQCKRQTIISNKTSAKSSKTIAPFISE